MDIDVEKNKIVVVWDAPPAHAKENRIWDPAYSPVKWYRYSGVYLYEECLRHGIQLVTPDIFFALKKRPDIALCVRERADPDLGVSLALQKAGVKLALITCSEQPVNACRFYWDLPRITSHFDNSEIVSGLRSWVSPKSNFIPWYAPHAYYTHIKKIQPNFKNRKFLVLMQGNVRNHWLRGLYVAIVNAVKPMPNFINREGYQARLNAIQYFSQHPGFDLYGHGWDRPVRYTHAYDEAIHKSYRGSPDDKYETIRQYKFSLVFENSYLGGYVQEKILDAMYAGSVPVYWGAPDVSDIIPENCFIDFRKFDCNFKKLDDYLRNMDETTYNSYIENINAFIASPQAYALSQENYVASLIKLFKSYS